MDLGSPPLPDGNPFPEGISGGEPGSALQHIPVSIVKIKLTFLQGKHRQIGVVRFPGQPIRQDLVEGDTRRTRAGEVRAPAG